MKAEFAALLLLVGAVCTSAAGTPLTLLTEEEATALQSRCMDGSPRGYYLRRYSGQDKWFIFLMGGGYCETKEQCDARAKTILGTSTVWPKEYTMTNMQVDDVAMNPKFARWNQVFIPYCTGDVHSGQRNASADTWGYHFTGYTGLKGLLTHLDGEQRLDKASEIVLSGCSAGAMGTFINADYVSKRYSNARVSALPVAGWFRGVETFTGAPGINNTARVGYSLWDSNVPAACRAGEGEENAWSCLLAPTLYPYLKTPFFIVESQLDSNQLYVQDKVPRVYNASTCPYLQKFQADMKSDLMSKLRDGDGVFFPNCYVHCVTAYNTTIGGVNYNSSFVDWYGGIQRRLVDNCSGTFSCNPTCASGSTGLHACKLPLHA